MNLLITGALGHIGSKLIREIPPGMFERVSLLDNLSTQRYGALFNLPNGVPFQFFEDDILEADLEEYFTGIDVVIHLAAATNAEDSLTSPEKSEGTNFRGTERVARACVACRSKLVFVSTTSVYGVQGDAVDETLPRGQLRPQSPYAVNKLQAEVLLQEIGARERLEFVTCRFGTLFGVSPGMRFHTAVNKFCWQAVMGLPLTVWRTALNQRRPYLDVLDAVEALKFIVGGNVFDGRTYNIVTTNATVQMLLDIIRLRVPDVATRYVDTPIMNQLSYTVSSERFARLGFEFRGNLEQGIVDTIELFRASCAGRFSGTAFTTAPRGVGL